MRRRLMRKREGEGEKDIMQPFYGAVFLSQTMVLLSTVMDDSKNQLCNFYAQALISLSAQSK